MFDLVTVGHFAVDLVTSPKISTPKPTLGGAPTYVSLTAKKLGATVSVISKVGTDFSDEYLGFLKANAIDLSGLRKVESASTTRFVLKYENSERKLQIKSRAPPIVVQDIPASLSAKAIHVAPIAHEISPEVIERLETLTNILSLDPQGFIRRFDGRGNVRRGRWHDPVVLKRIDVYKSSSNEIRAATGRTNLQAAMKSICKKGADIVIATRGIRGSKLLLKGRFHDLPACKPRVFKDPTGAGDAFIGAFLAEYVKGKAPVWCACVGSAAASFVLEGIGPTVFGEREETYSRAEDIYDKVAVQKK
jgi:sugar/nucleoside kinase (ribokinase family)